MTDPVGPLNRTLEALRRQIAEHARQLDAGSRTAQSSGTSQTTRTPASGRPNVDELKQRIADRVRSIDPQSPNGVRRRTRVFLESALAWEFGDDVLRDPSFQELVDELEASLSDHPELARQFGAVLGSDLD